jgi:hypothetical protein
MPSHTDHSLRRTSGQLIEHHITQPQYIESKVMLALLFRADSVQCEMHYEIAPFSLERDQGPRKAATNGPTRSAYLGAVQSMYVVLESVSRDFHRNPLLTSSQAIVPRYYLHSSTKSFLSPSLRSLSSHRRRPSWSCPCRRGRCRVRRSPLPSSACSRSLFEPYRPQ